MSETPEHEHERIVAFEVWVDTVRGRALGPLEGFNGGWAAGRAAADTARVRADEREPRARIADAWERTDRLYREYRDNLRAFEEGMDEIRALVARVKEEQG